MSDNQIADLMKLQEEEVLAPLTIKDLKRQVDAALELMKTADVRGLEKAYRIDDRLWLIGDFEIRRRK